MCKESLDTDSSATNFGTLSSLHWLTSLKDLFLRNLDLMQQEWICHLLTNGYSPVSLRLLTTQTNALRITNWVRWWMVCMISGLRSLPTFILKPSSQSWKEQMRMPRREQEILCSAASTLAFVYCILPCPISQKSSSKGFPTVKDPQDRNPSASLPSQANRLLMSRRM